MEKAAEGHDISTKHEGGKQQTYLCDIYFISMTCKSLCSAIFQIGPNSWRYPFLWSILVNLSQRSNTLGWKWPIFFSWVLNKDVSFFLRFMHLPCLLPHSTASNRKVWYSRDTTSTFQGNPTSLHSGGTAYAPLRWTARYCNLKEHQ